jgi:N-acetylglucosaminyldiphosphoundecaprenol N-acetyl-beta-D-mannosaminyltransferase
MPLVWAARLMKMPLPERVAGSDLIWLMCERAAQKRRRIFLLGGAPGIAEAAARILAEKYKGLIIAGTACPPFRKLAREEEINLLARIRDSCPDLLLIALGQPKGELWLAERFEKLLVPVSVQIGASLDFVAGKVRRAPRWMQRIGLEWAYRMAQEPRRLLGRYLMNAVFLMRMIFTRTRKKGPGLAQRQGKLPTCLR